MKLLMLQNSTEPYETQLTMQTQMQNGSTSKVGVNCPLWVTQLVNSAFHPSGVGKWLVIHVCTWITEEKTVRTADFGYVRQWRNQDFISGVAVSIDSRTFNRHFKALSLSLIAMPPKMDYS